MTIDDDLVVSGSLTTSGGISGSTITDTGISTQGKNLISRESDGSVHIGENSLVTRENNGRQQLYSTDANGKAIPIDITNGSKLLINGRDVDQAIDNVGALSAALTGLPTIPEDSPLSCGVGFGSHSGSNAISGGCASRFNERLSFNLAGAIIPSEQDYQGEDNSWSGRAGFVFKLGRIENTKPLTRADRNSLNSEIIELKSTNLELLDKIDDLESSYKRLEAIVMKK